jgi:hypothetical protein
MPVTARKGTEKTAVGKKGDGKKGTRDFFPCGKKYHVPFFPFSCPLVLAWGLPAAGTPLTPCPYSAAVSPVRMVSRKTG